MIHKTLDGHEVTDEQLDREAQSYERGEWPSGTTIRTEQEVRQLNVTLPLWVVNAADAEAARLNVSRRAVLNIWLADKAEQSQERRRRLAETPVVPRSAS